MLIIFPIYGDKKRFRKNEEPNKIKDPDFEQGIVRGRRA